MAVISDKILTLTSVASFPYGIISGGSGIHAGFEHGFASSESLGKIAVALGFLALGVLGKQLLQRSSLDSLSPTVESNQ